MDKMYTKLQDVYGGKYVATKGFSFNIKDVIFSRDSLEELCKEIKDNSSAVGFYVPKKGEKHVYLEAA